MQLLWYMLVLPLVGAPQGILVDHPLHLKIYILALLKDRSDTCVLLVFLIVIFFLIY